VDPTTDDHPVTVTLKHTAPGPRGPDPHRARQLRDRLRRRPLGGAQAIGGALHGDAAHQAWGVMDLLANTDFPDWRMKCLRALAGRGHPDGAAARRRHLVRLYVELDKLGDHERVADRGMGADDIIAKAQRILRRSSWT
jgi:phenol 2-monooxygenase